MPNRAVSVTAPDDTLWPALAAGVLGISAAWVAAGSAGLLAHGLRHAITWVLVLLMAAAAWPQRRTWREKTIVVAAAIGAVLMSGSTIATINILAVAVLQGALAWAHAGRSRALILAPALATCVLALFHFGQSTIASFWLATNAAAGALGAFGGAVAGRPLNVGSTFAGLDYLVVTLAMVGWLAGQKRISTKVSVGCVAAILIGHLAYLAVLAATENVLTSARTMRAQRLLTMCDPAERDAILETIKFQPPEIAAASTATDEAARSEQQKALDQELAELGLDRSELREIVASLKDEVAFPAWLDVGTRAALLDRMKPSLDRFQLSLLDGPASRSPYTWDGFLLATVPWNVPLLALAIHAALAAGILWYAFRPGGRGEQSLPVMSAADERRPVQSGEMDGGKRGRMLAYLAGAALLLPLLTIYSAGAGDFRGKRIVAYEKGFLNWLKPEYGNMRDNMNYGRLSAGMYGMVQPFVETLGMRFSRSKDLSADDINEADALVMFYPNRRWKKSQLDRIEEFVQRGGSLLVAGEHTILETKKQPGAIRYPGEEEEETLEEGDQWAGDEDGNRVNDLLERFGMRIAFDSAEFAVGGWLQSYATISHPTTTGLGDERNTFGVVVGASVEAGWRAWPMIVGRYGIGDIGDADKKDGGSYMGDSRYNAGERLGDIVLACEKRVGAGRVVLFGDTSSFTNNLIVSGHPFTARLYAYLAAPSDLPPQSAWRQLPGILLVAAVLWLLFRHGRPEGIVVFAIALSFGVWIATALTAAAHEVVPSGSDYAPPADEVNGTKSEYRGPNNLAYIDEAHHSAASDESLRPDGLQGLTFMLARHNYVPLSLPELTAERLMHEPNKRDPNLGVESLKARLVISIAPQREYTERECHVIDEYVSRGGRFIIAVGADDAGPARRLLARFGMNVGIHASEIAYGSAAHVPGPVTDKNGQALTELVADSLVPRVDQQPREATPLGHFKVPYATLEDDLGVYQPFVRFHAGWPVLCDDRNALILSRFGTQVGEDGQVRRIGLPLIVVKRYGTPLPQDVIARRPMRPTAGLIALIGDTGFAMNKNLEREDGQPIEGLRENAFFWRWFLDLLEHEEEKWRVPREEMPQQPRDPFSEMLPLLDIPILKKEVPPKENGNQPSGDDKPADVQNPATKKSTPEPDQAPSNIEGPLLRKPDAEPPSAGKEGE